MRCGRQATRRDSERPRSLCWEAGEPSELAPGDLSMLQLLLGEDMEHLVLEEGVGLGDPPMESGQ